MGKCKKNLKCIIITVLLLVIILSYIILNFFVYPVINEYAKIEINNMTVTAVNKAIFKVLKEGISYSDLINVTKDNDGKIIMIEANSMTINSLSNKMALETTNELDKIGEHVLKIPIGSLTKSPLMIGYGPSVSVKIMSAGSAFCRFKSDFEDAGINQTIHKIYLEICTNMEVILPALSKNDNSIIEIYIAEAVLIGDIPETYLKFGESSFIDFTP